MIGREIPTIEIADFLRVVRSLGSHRYIAGKKLFVHALVLQDAEGAPGEWARTTLRDPEIDAASRDERLWRSCSEVEVANVLERFWGTSDESESAREKLRADLERLELPLPEPEPFDETREDDIHPLLIDAGWELLQLAELDAERHRGAIAAYGEFVMFDVARFEEQESVLPAVHLYELPAFGPRELLEVARNSLLSHPIALYTQGEETYLDYVLRGVFRAAKLVIESEE